MRATLEQLKAMSDKELFEVWVCSRFPFEMLRPCDDCLTMHARGCQEHPGLAKDIKHLNAAFQGQAFQYGSMAEAGGALRPYLEELYALRLFYDSLYPPSDEAPRSTVALAESCSKSEVVT